MLGVRGHSCGQTRTGGKIMPTTLLVLIHGYLAMRRKFTSTRANSHFTRMARVGFRLFTDAVEKHESLRDVAVQRLAESLPPTHPLRFSFLRLSGGKRPH